MCELRRVYLYNWRVNPLDCSNSEIILKLQCLLHISWDSLDRSGNRVIGAVASLWTGLPKNRSSTAGRSKTLFYEASGSGVGPTTLPIQCAPWAFPRWGREADRTPASSAAVRNECPTPPLPNMPSRRAQEQVSLPSPHCAEDGSNARTLRP
jgi:hypothetical protein